MFLHKRLLEILKMLNNQKIVSINSLCNSFNLTDRTIRNDINNLNSFLKKYDMSINLKRKQGYYLKINNTKLYNDFLKEIEIKKHHLTLDSTEERIKYLLNILLYHDTYYNVDDICEELFVSQSTLKNYIKQLCQMIEKYDLELIQKSNIGIKIIGSEVNKRQCLFDNIISPNFQNYITSFTQEEYQIFYGINLNKLKIIIYNNLIENNINMSDFNLKNLIIHFALMISRVSLDYYINSSSSIKIDKKYKKFINNTIKKIEKEYNIIVSEGEKIYIYLHLVANIHTDDIYNDDNKIKNIINDLLENIYIDYNFDLRNDEILNNDLFYHFKSILNTKYLNLNKKNPLLNTIKSNFPLAFNITLTSISKIFSHLPYKLTEDEIAYVSLHIGASIERLFSGNLEIKNIILICGSGQATLRMLETRLNLFFKDKIKIINTYSYHEFINLDEKELENIDFIITTITLRHNITKIPNIFVNFALNNKDIESITKFLTQISHNKIKKSIRFFDKDLFLHLEKIDTKEDLLKKMCDILLSKNITNNDYLNQVLERESISNTNITDFFALPHPMSLCAKETKVFVAILDKPLLWNKKDTVKIIFLLAINQNDQQHLEYLYDIFIEVISNFKLQQKISKTKTFDEFIDILENNI